MPVRKVITRRSNHFRCYIPSQKNGRSTPCESMLEGSFARFCEISPLVKNYEVQPTKETFWLEGIQRSYTPDFLVRFVDGSEAWFEVKPRDRIDVPHIASDLQAIANSFSRSGRRFYVVDDIWLTAQPRLKNLNTVMYHRRGGANPAHMTSLQRALQRKQPRTIAELCLLLGESDAWMLIGQCIVGVDLEQIITPNSSIFLAGGHRHADFYA